MMACCAFTQGHVDISSAAKMASGADVLFDAMLQVVQGLLLYGAGFVVQWRPL